MSARVEVGRERGWRAVVDDVPLAAVVARLPPAVAHLAAGLLCACLAAVVCLPLWAGDRALAAYVCATAGVCGPPLSMLVHDPRTRRSGVQFLLAYGLWNVAWVAAWDSGPAPLLGETAKNALFVCAGVAALGYPTGRLPTRPARAWARQAAVTQVAALLVKSLLGGPGSLGYAPDAWWPGPLVTPGDEAAVRCAVAVADGVLAVTFVVVLVHKLRRMRRMHAVLSLPLLVPASMAGALAALLELRSALARWRGGGAPVGLEERLRLLAFQAPCLLVAAGFLLLVVGRWWHRTVMVRRVLDLATPPTLANVRAALRRVLDDPALDVALWLPDTARYVFTDGESLSAARRRTHDAGLWRHEILTHRGEPLALITLDPSLRSHGPMVTASFVAARRALEIAQAQESLLARERQVRQRVMHAEARERARIQRDLHDGAQQSLLSVCARLGVLEATAPGARVGAALRECRLGLLDSLAELRRLTQGIHPLALIHQGLGAALEIVAERLGVRIRLRVPEERFAFGVECAAYWALSEAVTNAARHARAADISVRVWTEGGVLVGVVEDDGVGGAVVRSNGGLAGVVDRLRGLGGSVSVVSEQSRGTSVRIEVPCE